MDRYNYNIAAEDRYLYEEHITLVYDILPGVLEEPGAVLVVHCYQ
jgi:hypothetical protein